MKEQCRLEVLSTSQNGQIIYCKTCKKYHIEFINLLFNFNKEEFKTFSSYFENLNLSSHQFRNNNFNRKIIISIGHKNVNALFNHDEIIEIKKLLSGAIVDRCLPNYKMITHHTLILKVSEN